MLMVFPVIDVLLKVDTGEVADTLANGGDSRERSGSLAPPGAAGGMSCRANPVWRSGRAKINLIWALNVPGLIPSLRPTCINIIRSEVLKF